MSYELMETMVNFQGEEIQIYTTRNYDGYIETATAYAVNERMQVIRKGTFDTVSAYFYRKGFIY